MIKIGTLLLVNGILTAFYAVLLLLFPEKFFEMRGMPHDAYAIFIARLMGPSQVGYAILSILAARSNNRATMRLVALISFITWTLGGLILLLGKVTLEMNASVWMDIVFAAVFSLAFGYHVFLKPQEQ